MANVVFAYETNDEGSNLFNVVLVFAKLEDIGSNVILLDCFSEDLKDLKDIVFVKRGGYDIFEDVIPLYRGVGNILENVIFVYRHGADPPKQIVLVDARL